MLLELEEHVVHQSIEVWVKDGLKYVKTGCGVTLQSDKRELTHPEWSGWHCDVTCDGCKARSRGTWK